MFARYATVKPSRSYRVKAFVGLDVSTPSPTDRRPSLALLAIAVDNSAEASP